MRERPRVLDCYLLVGSPGSCLGALLPPLLSQSLREFAFFSSFRGSSSSWPRRSPSASRPPGDERIHSRGSVDTPRSSAHRRNRKFRASARSGCSSRRETTVPGVTGGNIPLRHRSFHRGVHKHMLTTRRGFTFTRVRVSRRLSRRA